MDKGDKAIYKCKTINESYSIDLQVAFYPSFITLHQPDTITVKKNESVLFDCMVNGYPTPKVSPSIVLNMYQIIHYGT